MMMMMIMIAGLVDSITTPIKSWLDTNMNKNMNMNMKMTVKEVGDIEVECIVCLSEVTLGDRLAMLERCKHGFHVECVEAWLKDHPNCPLCRTPVVVVVSSGGHLYEMMTRFGFHLLQTIATWLTTSFTQGLQSSLSESCTYL